MGLLKTKTKWNTPDGNSPVIAFFSKIAPVSKEVTRLFNDHTFPVYIKRSDLLLKPGSKADHLYFIEKGVMRGYIKEDNKQITTWINSENHIVASIRTLGTTNPCLEYLQALEDTCLIALPFTFTEFVFNTYPETNYVGRRLWESSYQGAEERAYICRITSAERKYQYFMGTRPDLINRIPLKYIASYLGMTLETLSRVRSKRK